MKRELRAAGLALIAALLLGGCATTRGYLEQEPPANLARTSYLNDVPFYPQEQYQCGPAALTTVLNYYGVNTSPDTIKPLVYLPEREGSVQTEMLAAARSFNMLAYVIEPNLDSLFYEIEAGHPVLVMQNLGFSWYPRWHYAVMIGYDLNTEQVTLRSGTTREWRTSIANFDTTWARSERWAVVYLPPGKIPKTAEPLGYLQSANALEQTGRKEAALLSYQAAAQHWPDALLPAMALGNFAASNQDWPTAEQAYRQALQRHPATAAAWNNLGYSLAQQNCPDTARDAVACAIKLAPDNAAFRDTLRELDKQSTQAIGLRCQAVRDCPASIQRSAR